MILRFSIAIVILAVIAGGLVGFNLFRQQAIEQFFANRPVSPVAVSTVTAEERVWTPTLDAIGSVGAASGVDLTVETSGVVRSVEFESNAQVEAGQLLVQLEDGVQRADLEAARTQAGLEQQQLQRARELRERGVGSNVTLETASAAAEAASAQVEKLEAVLQQKQLRAPFSGTIGIPQVDVGQFISPGTTVATLQDLGRLRVDFTLPEQQLPFLRTGQKVRVGISEGSLPYDGKVIGIDPKVDPQSRLVALRAEISAPRGELTPGQFVRIKLELPEETGVVALPQTAVVTSLYGDYVYAVRQASAGEGDSDAGAEDDDLEVRQVFVKTGRRSDDLVEVVEGVEPGERIVSAGQNRLINGSPVNIDNSVTLGAGNAGQAEAE